MTEQEQAELVTEFKQSVTAFIPLVRAAAPQTEPFVQLAMACVMAGLNLGIQVGTRNLSTEELGEHGLLIAEQTRLVFSH